MFRSSTGLIRVQMSCSTKWQVVDWRHNMVTRQGRVSDPTDPWSEAGESRGGRGAGALFLAALLGVGIGLLAAPQPGTRTRKLLAKRLAALGEGMGESLEDV